MAIIIKKLCFCINFPSVHRQILLSIRSEGSNGFVIVPQKKKIRNEKGFKNDYQNACTNFNSCCNNSS